MIIRRSASTLQLITQPAHAALSGRIMREWGPRHFPETGRKASILNAVEQHDCGWAEFDEALVLDTATGRLLDFTEVPDVVKRDTSSRGIAPLAADPYAAALAAQHRLHVYRRNAGNSEWAEFFAEMTAARDGTFARPASSPWTSSCVTTASCVPAISRRWPFVTSGPIPKRTAAAIPCNGMGRH